MAKIPQARVPPDRSRCGAANRARANVAKPALLLAAVLSLLLAAPVPDVAHAAGAPGTRASTAEVYTRAVVRSVSTDEARHLYIRLKLVPKSKIPFSTVTYRVLDARLVSGLREGDSVAFKAERIDGENVLTAIHAAKPCGRFEECR